MMGLQVARALPQAHGASIVPEPKPCTDDIGNTCAGERVERWKTRKKFFVLGNDAINLRLLQHDLGDQNAVGITRAPPRQIAFMAPVKTEHCGTEGLSPCGSLVAMLLLQALVR